MPEVEGRNLWELLVRRAAATPDGVAAVDEEDRTLTFADLLAEAERAAAGLARLGVGEGDVVSWQLPTWLESQTLVLALSRLGAIQNPLLPIYREREVGFVTRQARSKLLIVPSEWAGFGFEAMARGIATEIGAEGGSLDVLVADRTLPQGDPDTLAPPPAADGDAPVRWYFYTSGTTSDPKGAQHTDRTIMACAAGMNDRLELTEHDRNAVVFPFTHIGGITWLFSALMVGFPTAFVERFDPARTVEVMRRFDVTLAGAGTPFHMVYLQAQRELPDGERLFPSVRCFPGGGAPKPPQLHYDLKDAFGVGVVSGYGLTEAPIITMGSVRDTDEQLAHTEGRATGTTQLRAVTLEGKEAGIGEEGEIRAKAPQLMVGYLDSSLDAEAFDDEGWFRTGDLGRIDADGMVTITGRVKDVIIRNMENISAKEVEDVLFGHPAVADVAVIGVPDPRTGERVCAVVVPAEPDEPPSLDDLTSFCREQGLMTQKLPERLELVDVLPRNPTGKVLKFELRDRFGDA